jgi:CheY-like chemotaxis protein
LGVVRGNLELLQEEPLSAAAKEFVKNSISATYKGADLTKKMLSFARRAQLTPTILGLNGILEDIRIWGGRTIPASVDLKVSLAKGLWPVSADLASTESAILNLIINARDAMNDHGILTIETRNHTVEDSNRENEREDLGAGNYVMVAVSDTGIGMPKEQIALSIEPFFTTKAVGEGSGLGLSMVHGFMKQSGGSVHIYSELGVGTSVKLFFPAKLDGKEEAHGHPTEIIPMDSTNARILVAEDQPEVLAVITVILEKAGHQVVGIGSGDEAIEVFLNQGPFDMLLTDVVMPGTMQGPDLAREIRKSAPDFPIVFMTGYASEATMYGNGLHDEDIRLMKPVPRMELLSAVSKVLSEQ